MEKLCNYDKAVMEAYGFSIKMTESKTNETK